MPGAGLLSYRFPELAGACWNEFSVDGALANICARVENVLRDVVGARIVKPLVGRCYCGAPFHTTLRSIVDFGTAGACRCGRLHFFTRETCRRPILAPELTHAFDSVAA